MYLKILRRFLKHYYTLTVNRILRAKVLPQTPQKWSFLAVCCSRICVLAMSLRLQVFMHSLHSNGRSSECIVTWIDRCDSLWHVYPDKNYVNSKYIYVYSINLPHVSQINLWKFSVWICLWKYKSALVLNNLVQMCDHICFLFSFTEIWISQSHPLNKCDISASVLK